LSIGLKIGDYVRVKSTALVGAYLLFSFAGRISEKHLPEHMFDYDYNEGVLRCQYVFKKINFSQIY